MGCGCLTLGVPRKVGDARPCADTPSMPRPFPCIHRLNLPDYRPRKTQFSQAIKKIRALQRTRRNRGFAFSQTEDSQERIIRSYDTTIAKAKG